MKGSTLEGLRKITKAWARMPDMPPGFEPSIFLSRSLERHNFVSPFCVNCEYWYPHGRDHEYYWDMTPCSLLDVYGHFTGAFCPYLLLPWTWGRRFPPKRRYTSATFHDVTTVLFIWRLQQDVYHYEYTSTHFSIRVLCFVIFSVCQFSSAALEPMVERVSLLSSGLLLRGLSRQLPTFWKTSSASIFRDSRVLQNTVVYLPNHNGKKCEAIPITDHASP
jgi:hypothetical protein